ncbi:MAG: globin [Planctomycetes bacterium]|nr:globin [Planctomycetota bacterium]
MTPSSLKPQSVSAHEVALTARMERLLCLLSQSVVRPSFERCCQDANQFFDSFYFLLCSTEPRIGTLFAQVDMRQQNQLIRSGVEHLLWFAEGSLEAKAKLRRLGRSHSREGLQIEPQLYDTWVNTVIECVREHDPETSEAVESAWREVMEPGIELMKSLY